MWGVDPTAARLRPRSRCRSCDADGEGLPVWSWVRANSAVVALAFRRSRQLLPPGARRRSTSGLENGSSSRQQSATCAARGPPSADATLLLRRAVRCGCAPAGVTSRSRTRSSTCCTRRSRSVGAKKSRLKRRGDVALPRSGYGKARGPETNRRAAASGGDVAMRWRRVGEHFTRRPRRPWAGRSRGQSDRLQQRGQTDGQRGCAQRLQRRRVDRSAPAGLRTDRDLVELRAIRLSQSPGMQTDSASSSAALTPRRRAALRPRPRQKRRRALRLLTLAALLHARPSPVLPGVLGSWLDVGADSLATLRHQWQTWCCRVTC